MLGEGILQRASIRITVGNSHNPALKWRLSDLQKPAVLFCPEKGGTILGALLGSPPEELTMTPVQIRK